MTSQSDAQTGARRGQRPRLTILSKLLLAFAVPTLALFALFAVVAHEVARGDLEAELGTRLSAVAASAALHVRGKYLVDLGPGDETDRAYQNVRRKLEAVAQATGVARIYIFDHALGSRVDTAADVPIGSTYFQAELDRHELGRVFSQGAAVSSVLFEGTDGRLYKAGYAPVRASETEDEIVLALAVQAPAAYFARLAALRRSLLVYGAILALVVLGISIVVAARITRPVRHLAMAAERIGRGELGVPVARTSADEIGFLATTMEEMRRELKARDERLQLMLSGIAHEVRNPLAGIELYAGILRDELEPGDDRRSHVARIEKELKYLGAVVSDFLDYARRPAPELAELDLAELAQDVVDLCRADGDAAGVAIVLEAQPAPCRGDAGQLRRALLNLVRNAIQASAGQESRSSTNPGTDKDSSAVRVVVAPATSGGERGAGSVDIQVINRGPAIPEDVRARMFEPFFTTREKGTGLGLAFVREIVTDHSGTIRVDCAGGETCFRLHLAPGDRP